jgi:hypothetical protein
MFLSLARDQIIHVYPKKVKLQSHRDYICIGTGDRKLVAGTSLNLAKQIQLMHNIIVYSLTFFCSSSPEMFWQVTMPLSKGLYQKYIRCA